MKPWPRFKPLDPNVTCSICGRAWNFHGTKSDHCPPCGKPVKRARIIAVGLAGKKARVLVGGECCTRIAGHKGRCKC